MLHQIIPQLNFLQGQVSSLKFPKSSSLLATCRPSLSLASSICYHYLRFCTFFTRQWVPPSFLDRLFIAIVVFCSVPQLRSPLPLLCYFSAKCVPRGSTLYVLYSVTCIFLIFTRTHTFVFLSFNFISNKCVLLLLDINCFVHVLICKCPCLASLVGRYWYYTPIKNSSFLIS